jgi:hypothetical protein
MEIKSARADRDLVWVVQVSSALSLGTLAGLLYSVQAVTPSIRFQFSPAAVIAFAIAAAISAGFWHVVFQLSAGGETHTRGRKRLLALLAGSLAGALVLAFAYPLKDFSSEKVSEISFGALIALIFLTVFGLLFWRVVRFLEGMK